MTFLNGRLLDDGLVTFILSNDDTVDRGYGLGSRENATVAYRPVLAIETQQSVTVPEPATLCLFRHRGVLAVVRRRACGARRHSRSASAGVSLPTQTARHGHESAGH